jgi:hypothetical protein
VRVSLKPPTQNRVSHSGEGPRAGKGYMSFPIHGSAAACRDPRSTTEARAPERNHITGRHDGVRPPLAAFIESSATETIPCPGAMSPAAPPAPTVTDQMPTA